MEFHGTRFLVASLLASYPLSQIVKVKTRCESVLDKIFTNIKHWYNPPTLLPALGNSDHQTVLVTPLESPPASGGFYKFVRSRGGGQNGRCMLFQAIKNINWSPLLNLTSCEDMVTCFYDTVLPLLDHFLPWVERTRYSTDKPWVTPHFRQLIKWRQQALERGDHSEYKRLRNKTTAVGRSLRRRFYQSKVNQLYQSDPRSWWKHTKSFLNLNTSSKQSNLSHLQISSEDCLPDVINKFFVSVSSHLSPLSPPSEGHDGDHNNNSNDDDKLDYTISVAEVEQALSQINIYKSPGPDAIPNWFLRDFAPFLSIPLCAIYNASIQQGFVPMVWKSAEVVPIPKVSPPRDLSSDLRPISLLPTAAKILESFVKKWILHLVTPKLDPQQFGCLAGRSTLHALVSALHSWTVSLDTGQSLRTVFVDFRKAFDLVDHNILLEKLRQKSVPEQLCKWFQSYLYHRRQRVRVIGYPCSQWLFLNGGMPQGSLLGPISFIIHIDDLHLLCDILKYVDDTTLSETIGSNSPISDMQSFLDQLQTWSDQNNMQINSFKTKEMILGSASKKDWPSLTIGDTPLERVSAFKLLGVHISADLRWETHIDYIISKAVSRLYFLKQLKRAGLLSSHLSHFPETILYTSFMSPFICL